MRARFVGRLGRALRHRNYRLFIAGQGISLIGTWLTRFATTWMAYRLTGSSFMLGLVAFFGYAPTSITAPIAGVLVDRWDRHRVIVATQIAAMLQSAALAAFALAGVMTVWHLIVLGAVQGVINGFDMPARQSFVRQMVDDPADLANAIALNSSMVNVGKLLGPVIAAVLVGLVGEGLCFAIDAASYLAVIASLLQMRVTRPPRRAAAGSVIGDLAVGVRYVASVRLVRAILLLMVAASILGGAYTTLMPVVAAEAIGGGPYTLGVLLAAGGLGALAGALYLASRKTVVGLAGVIGRCLFGLGAGLAGLELATTLWVGAPVLCVIGFSLMVQLASTNTILQTIVEPDKLGRVMSLYAVSFTTGLPLGAFLEGSLAERIGAVHTLFAAGVVCAALAVIYLRALPGLRRASRELYVRLGLIESRGET